MIKILIKENTLLEQGDTPTHTPIIPGVPPAEVTSANIPRTVAGYHGLGPWKWNAKKGVFEKASALDLAEAFDAVLDPSAPPKVLVDPETANVVMTQGRRNIIIENDKYFIDYDGPLDKYANLDDTVEDAFRLQGRGGNITGDWWVDDLSQLADEVREETVSFWKRWKWRVGGAGSPKLAEAEMREALGDYRGRWQRIKDRIKLVFTPDWKLRFGDIQNGKLVVQQGAPLTPAEEKIRKQTQSALETPEGTLTDKKKKELLDEAKKARAAAKAKLSKLEERLNKSVARDVKKWDPPLDNEGRPTEAVPESKRTKKIQEQIKKQKSLTEAAEILEDIVRRLAAADFKWTKFFFYGAINIFKKFTAPMWTVTAFVASAFFRECQARGASAETAGALSGANELDLTGIFERVALGYLSEREESAKNRAIAAKEIVGQEVEYYYNDYECIDRMQDLAAENREEREENPDLPVFKPEDCRRINTGIYTEEDKELISRSTKFRREDAAMEAHRKKQQEFQRQHPLREDQSPGDKFEQDLFETLILNCQRSKKIKIIINS